jgi:hypothetical protein
MGHAAGVVVVAVIGIMLRDALPPIEVVSAWSERLVGGALIAVGLWALGRSARITTAPHSHGAVAHDHLHVRRGPAWFTRLGHAHASFYLGILHGIAGSSHFFGVLPALALPTRAAALTYIGAFGAGTIAAMTMFAAVIGWIGGRAHHTPSAHRAMMITAAALAIIVGGVWLI